MKEKEGITGKTGHEDPQGVTGEQGIEGPPGQDFSISERSSGLDLVCQERLKQIKKHGRVYDLRYTSKELLRVASRLINGEKDGWGLSEKHSEIGRKIIAAALIIADIDRDLLLQRRPEFIELSKVKAIHKVYCKFKDCPVHKGVIEQLGES